MTAVLVDGIPRAERCKECIGQFWKLLDAMGPLEDFLAQRDVTITYTSRQDGRNGFGVEFAPCSGPDQRVEHAAALRDLSRLLGALDMAVDRYDLVFTFVSRGDGTVRGTIDTEPNSYDLAREEEAVAARLVRRALAGLLAEAATAGDG